MSTIENRHQKRKTFRLANGIALSIGTLYGGLLLLGGYSQAQLKPQMLTIGAEAQTQSSYTIKLELPQNAEQQAKGLMFRKHLPDNRGMLFRFGPPQPVRFWMKNTPIPLDMIFLRQGKVVAVVASAPPCTSNPCPTYGTEIPVNQVIELRGGRATQLGIKAGDRLPVRFF